MAFRAPARLRLPPPLPLPLVPRCPHRGLASHSHGRNNNNNGGGDGQQVAVIGGGLTGLATAYFLAKRLPASARIDLYEATDRLGGWIRTDRVRVNVGGVGGVVPFERGPRTLSTLRGDTWRFDDLALYELILDLGLQPSFPKDLPRYLCYPDHLVTMPPDAAVLDYLRESLFLECAVGALTAAARYFTGRLRSNMPGEEISIAHWLRLVTGSDAVGTHLVSAMMHGIYGGDIERLSMSRVLTRVAYSTHAQQRMEPGRCRMPKSELLFLDRMMTDDDKHGLVSALANRPKGALMHFGAAGMEALPKALEQALKGQRNVTIYRQSPATKFQYDKTRDKIKVSANRLPRLYDRVVSTTSSDTLVPSAGIPSVSIMTVNLWYPFENLKKPRGFGYLIPEATTALGLNPERALGVFFDSDVIPERAPDEPRGTKLLVLLGGRYYRDYNDEHYPAPAPPPDEEQAVALAKGLLERHLGIPRDTPCHAVAALARDCIPQHEIGHGARLQHVQQWLSAEYGGRLTVANGSYGRIGAVGALRNAHGAAHAVAEHRLCTGLEDFFDYTVVSGVSIADIPCRQAPELKHREEGGQDG